MKRNAAGTYTLTFAQASGTKNVMADKVVLALPFSILRTSVDLSKAGFEPLKLIAIREQGMGTNSKLHVQFSSRFWRPLGSNGETFSDTGYQNTWEVTRAQPGKSGILVDYTGGKIGASFGSGTPDVAGGHVPRAGRAGASGRDEGLERQGGASTSGPAIAGRRARTPTGRSASTSGSPVWRRRRQGNCLFAGEHTSIDFQGYLNGAVETGQRAAGEILADLK